MKLGYIAGIIFIVVIVFLNGDTIQEKLGILTGFGIAILGLFVLVTVVNTLFKKAPDSYQIEENVIKIPFLPFYAIKIKYEDIEEITKEPASHFSFRTVYLTTRLWGAVLIKTKRGSNYVISPKDPDAFIADVKKHLANFS